MSRTPLSAHLLCFDYSLGQASLDSQFKWLSFQSSKITLPECKIFRLIFPLESLFLLQQIQPFLVRGLPC